MAYMWGCCPVCKPLVDHTGAQGSFPCARGENAESQTAEQGPIKAALLVALPSRHFVNTKAA